MSERAVLGSFWPLQPCLLQHGGTAVVNITVHVRTPGRTNLSSLSDWQ